MPSHYLNQCWNIVNWNLKNKLHWNCNRNSNIFVQENPLEDVVCEMASILSRPQCVKNQYLSLVDMGCLSTDFTQHVTHWTGCQINHCVPPYSTFIYLYCVWMLVVHESHAMACKMHCVFTLLIWVYSMCDISYKPLSPLWWVDIIIRKSKDYVYGIWVYKALDIWKGYYRVKKSLVSYMKPWTEARNNKYMKYHSKLTYQLSFWNVSRKVD